eukprot:GEZU01013427.1.p2 GENE.GEZU01013427.1~~GEZU01013427.1.p2  ORF type:complete len:124 (+),score=7.96 GEZU01013427.1:82-453(+)
MDGECIPGDDICPVCGNGKVEDGEDCDDDGPCCNPTTCKFRPSSYVCRAAAGPCDVAEKCTGTSSSCPANKYRPPSFVCRPAAGQCDVAETCPGNSASCPNDQYKPNNTPCDDGNSCTLGDYW